MKSTLNTPAIIPRILACTAAIVLVGATASAAENDLRIIPQLTAGTAGAEPGIALEWRSSDLPLYALRPEVFVNEDGRLGAGAAVIYDISPRLGLPRRQALAVGPRLLYHNADHYGWEADALASWSFDLMGGASAWKHSVGVLGALGVAHDKEHGDNDLGASAGIFYSYRF
jgi:hypothetical protein